MRGEAVETLLGVRHQARVVWRSSRPFAVGAMFGAVLFSSIAALVAYMQSVSPVPVPFIGVSLIGVTWFSLLVLPAIGGGGDDDASALASVPAGKSFRSGVHFLSTASDLASGVLVPALGTLGAFVASWPGWLAGLAMGLLGLVAGQVTGAAAARMTARTGSAVSLLVTCGLSAVLVRYGSTSGPGAWFEALVHHPMSYVALVVALVLLWVAARALTDTHPFASRRARTRHLPAPPSLALFAASLSGVTRALVARNSLLTVVLVPLFARAVGMQPGTTLPLVLTVSACVMAGANGFSYDGGGASWVLGRVGFRRVLLVRYAVAATWVAVVASVALSVSLAVGAPVTWTTGAQMLLVTAGGAAAGLVPSVKRPSSVDLDLPRAQPAPPASAVGVMFRTLILAGLASFLPLAFASIVVGGYVSFALWHAARLGSDPTALAALS